MASMGRRAFPRIGITAELTSGMTFMELYAKYILAFQDWVGRVGG